jgi:SSS family solute:Na+ symporter
VRGLVTSVLWFATLFILAGQLIGVATILNVVAGVPMPAGAAIGGALMTTYFAAGGLLGSAWINLVQLIVLLIGFAIAVPIAMTGAGGWSGLVEAPALPAHYASFWNGGASTALLLLLVPPFVSSPGLLQKAYGARSERAVRMGTALNGAALMVFAFVPAVLGMAARAHHPELAQDQLALPTLLTENLPSGIGSLLLAAIFSAEISTADAVLFMLATSLSQDLYRRFVNPGASDGQVLKVARYAAIGGGALGILLAILTPTIIGALSVFYTVLGAGLFLPIVVGLHARRPQARAVGVSIVAGMATVLVVQIASAGRGFGIWTPALCGLTAAASGYGIATLVRRVLMR